MPVTRSRAQSATSPITDPTTISPKTVYDFTADADMSSPTSMYGATLAGTTLVQVVNTDWSTWSPQDNGLHILKVTSGVLTISFSSPAQAVAVQAEPNSYAVSNVTMDPRDANDMSLGSITVPINGQGGASYIGVVSTTANIASVQVSDVDLNAQGFAVTYITYGGSSDSALQVPLFRQTALPWSASAYGDPSIITPEYCGAVPEQADTQSVANDIYHCGSLLSDWAMILNYFGEQYSFQTSPATLNSWLRASSPLGYSGLSVVMPRVISSASPPVPLGPAMATSQRDDTNLDDLLNGTTTPNNVRTPVILGVNPDSQGHPQHYVLAIGTAIGPDGQPTWAISDTFFNYTTLESYGNSYVDEQWTELNPSNQPSYQSITTMLASPAELLVTDPQGNQTGLDPRSGIAYSNIPNAVYIADDIAISDTGQVVTGHTEKTFYTWLPTSGTYSTSVIGTGSGSYSATFVTVDQSNKSTTVIAAGQAQLGSVDRYAESYSTSPGVAAVVTLPPVLSLPGPQNVVYQLNPSLTFSVSATDPDDQASTLRFSATGLPASLALTDQLNGSASVSGQVTALPATYSATIVATDPGGLSSSQPITITVATPIQVYLPSIAN